MCLSFKIKDIGIKALVALVNIGRVKTILIFLTPLACTVSTWSWQIDSTYLHVSSAF